MCSDYLLGRSTLRAKRPNTGCFGESSTFQRHIRKRTLADCQFPDTLTDAVGTITKPPEW